MRRSRRDAPEDGPGLTVARLVVGDQEYAVLSMSLPEHGPSHGTLTKAERRVARLALGGYSNDEIAEARGTSPRTIANQLASIYRKLRAGSRAELAAAFSVLDVVLDETQDRS